MKRKRICIILTAFVLTISFSGCTKQEEQTQTADSIKAEQTQQIQKEEIAKETKEEQPKQEEEQQTEEQQTEEQQLTDYQKRILKLDERRNESSIAKEEIERFKQEYPDLRIADETGCFVRYMDLEVPEIFPKLKELQNDLIKKYPLSELNESQEIQPIQWEYINSYQNGKPVMIIRLILNFKESITQKQAVEAMSYAGSFLQNVFPKGTEIDICARVAYTEDGKLDKTMGRSSKEIYLSYELSGKEDWEIMKENEKIEPLDIETLTEEEKLAGGIEPPMHEQKGVNPMENSELIEQNLLAGFEPIRILKRGTRLLRNFKSTEVFGNNIGEGCEFLIIKNDDGKILYLAFGVVKIDRWKQDTYIGVAQFYFHESIRYSFGNEKVNEVIDWIDYNVDMLQANSYNMKVFGDLCLVIMKYEERMNMYVFKPDEASQYVIENMSGTFADYLNR